MHLENNVSFADLGIRPTPGTLAALMGYWRGRNRADNEELKGKTATAGGSTDSDESGFRQRVRERYRGKG